MSIDFLLSPSGCGLSPRTERQRAILRAIEEGRLDDAARRLDARDFVRYETDSPLDLSHHAWEVMLRGYHALRSGQTKQAVAFLFQSAATAGAAAISRSAAGTAEREAGSAELAALANLLAGRALRRQERVLEAEIAHQCAAQIAAKLGLTAALWAARVELAQDAALASDSAQVETRFAHALQATDDPARKAHTLTLRAKYLAGASDPGRAGAAARESASAWRAIDAGSIESFRAARLLGEALLSAGECSLGDPKAGAAELIREATTHLQSAREGLEPFGAETDSDLREIDDLLAVAERISAAAGA